MIRQIFTAALSALAIFAGAFPVAAQQPLSWNYGFDSDGDAWARYPGGVTVGSPTGGSQGVGTINATGLYVNGVAVGGGGGTPGGSDTQLQYNNAGAFGGISGATTNGTSVTLTSPTLVTPAIGAATGTSLALTGDLSTSGGQIVLPNGAPTTPSITFSTASTTGIYRSAAATVGISAGGTLRASISGTAATFTVPISGTSASFSTPLPIGSGGTGVTTGPGSLLVSQGTFTASGGPAIALPSTYKLYRLVIWQMQNTSAGFVQMQFSYDNAATWKSGASDYKYSVTSSGGTVASTTAGAILISSTQNVSATIPVQIDCLILLQPTSGAATTVTCKGEQQVGGGSYTYISGGYTDIVYGLPTNLRWIPTAGTVTGGYALYGMPGF